MLDGSFLILSGIIPWHKTRKNLNAITMPSSTDRTSSCTKKNSQNWWNVNWYRKRQRIALHKRLNCLVNWSRLNEATSFAIVRSVSAAIPGSTELSIHRRTHIATQIECKALFLFFPPFLCVSPLCAKPVYSMNSLHPTVSCVCIGFSNSPPARCQCITDNIRTVCFHRSRSSACMYPFVKLDCARFSHWKCQAEYCRTQHWNAFHRGSCERFCIFVYNFANALVYRFGRYTQLK